MAEMYQPLIVIIYVIKRIECECQPSMLAVLALLPNTMLEASRLIKNSLSDPHFPMCVLLLNKRVMWAVE